MIIRSVHLRLKTERGRNSMEKLMEKIFSKENLNKAYIQVYRNKGSQVVPKEVGQMLQSNI